MFTFHYYHRTKEMDSWSHFGKLDSNFCHVYNESDDETHTNSASDSSFVPNRDVGNSDTLYCINHCLQNAKEKTFLLRLWL